MTAPVWFKRRTYRHLDMPVGVSFAKKAQSAAYVARHPFTPLMHFLKVTKRFKPTILDKKGKLRRGSVRAKKRDIMYASHRDACIFSFYSWQISSKLEAEYLNEPFGACVIAYRSLGKSNYHFSFEVLQFALEHRPCAILGFDVSGFFDNLDHRILKSRLKSVLGVSELPSDWYAVFKAATKFHYVESERLRTHAIFGPRYAPGERGMIASIADVVSEGVPIQENKNRKGIPQGTPISATFANLYMLEFDRRMDAFCSDIGGLYRRYSDDILIVCAPDLASFAEAFLKAEIISLELDLNDDKTERSVFDPLSDDRAQYLGFSLDQSGATIRASSLARQWRKLKRAIKRTGIIGQGAIANGSAEKVYTKKLRRRFASLAPRKDQPIRNFSSYARRSAATFGSKRILAQVRRLERKLDGATKDFKALSVATSVKAPPPTSGS